VLVIKRQFAAVNEKVTGNVKRKPH